MNQVFAGWVRVAEMLNELANDPAIDPPIDLNCGQRASLRALADRLPNNGVIIADEVGMGKTRIAAAVARCVIAAGGRVAILVPPGLGYQWSKELQDMAVDAPPILRSLKQYLDAWEVDKCAPWFKESALVLSHSFTNWRLGAQSDSWRWALLPEIYARWRKQCRGRWPNGYFKDVRLSDKRVKQAAYSIVGAMIHCPKRHRAWKEIQELFDETSWRDARRACEYEKNAELRPGLQRAVGLGLGVFDLVIIDEAHKSRGQNSGVNQLLNGVVLQSKHGRRLGMTATPVELDSTQWTQMLGRIRVKEQPKAAATKAISRYAQAVASVRQCASDEQVREKYYKASLAFKQALEPYLLRRDKREDTAVIEFEGAYDGPYYDYRHMQEIPIKTGELSVGWKQAVCAAEALSFVTRHSDSIVAKRLRLTLGNGHGIAALLDQSQRDDEDDEKQTKVDIASVEPAPTVVESGQPDVKRRARADWWQNVAIQPFNNGSSPLLSHPAILEAVAKIESVCQQGEKVLVFGRFTRPLRALVQLLNAREMLRSVDSGRPWPQSKVSTSEWDAISAAHQQLSRRGTLNRDLLDRTLAKQYRTLENKRHSTRGKLINRIDEGFREIPPDKCKWGRALFDAFRKDVDTGPDQDRSNGHHALTVVSRAMHELLDTALENVEPRKVAQAFVDLVTAASTGDVSDSDDDEQLDEDDVADGWADLRVKLKEEFDSPEGGYARLMYGETKPATRRFMQLAFNRKHGNPKVLVAQSLVGREGLNLHRACRTVVLLHPEWNPGVVEQQIGRVDRIGSLWAEKLHLAVTQKQRDDDLPRIEILAVVFQGTYDEYNWQVLHERWDDLRAQLHGIVISPRLAARYPDAGQMITEINDAAPSFSPLVRNHTPQG